MLTHKSLEQLIVDFENKLQILVRSMDTLIDKYFGVIAKKQFEANQIECLQDIFDATKGTCVLTGKITQMVIIESLMWTVPSGTTSLTLQIGRFTYVIANPATINSVGFLKIPIGQGDAIKATIAPVGAGTLSLFGYRTGNTQQL